MSMPPGKAAAILLVGILSLAPMVGARADAQAARTALPHGRHLAPDRVARIDQTLQRYVDEHRIPGAVALVLQDGKPVYERAVGWSDKEAGRRMTPDALFRIASQTKALTSVAILMLMEEGRLTLGNRVSEFIPAFAKTTVATTKDGEVSVVPAARQITIRDLLTHTSGISYGTDRSVAALYEAKGLGPAAGYGWYTADKNEPVCATMERLARLPFVAQPGTKWVYGYSTDVLGCVVERASGMPLDRFIEERITRPLGMTDTQFFVAPGERSRLSAVYASGTDGTYVRAPDGARGQGDYVDGPRKSFSGGAGLVSTVRDYARFLEMIRLGGAMNGRRVLSPRTVALMTTNQVGTLYPTPGLGWSLAFETTEQYGGGGLSSVGSYGWGSAYGGWYRVDPADRLTIVFEMQLVPNATDIREKFPTLVYSALVP